MRHLTQYFYSYARVNKKNLIKYCPKPIIEVFNEKLNKPFKRGNMEFFQQDLCLLTSNVLAT